MTKKVPLFKLLILTGFLFFSIVKDTTSDAVSAGFTVSNFGQSGIYMLL